MHMDSHSRDFDSEEPSGLRGFLTLVGCSAVMVAIAYAAMLALTSPEGWATRAAHVAMHETAPSTATLVSNTDPVVYADAR